jgi:hypothetical protein
MLSCAVRRAPLVPIGSLTTCTIDFLAIAHQFRDRRRRRGGCRLLAFARFRRRGAQDVRGMQEGGALQADVHERGLHARHHPQHAALVDVADVATPRSAFDVHLLQHAVLDHGHAGLARRDIDEYLFGHDRALPSLFARLRQRGRHVMTPNSRSSIAVSCRGKPITPE